MGNRCPLSYVIVAIRRHVECERLESRTPRQDIIQSECSVCQAQGADGDNVDIDNAIPPEGWIGIQQIEQPCVPFPEFGLGLVRETDDSEGLSGSNRPLEKGLEVFEGKGARFQCLCVVIGNDVLCDELDKFCWERRGTAA